MKYQYGLYAAISLIASCSFLSGCDTSKSETPSEETLINALNALAINHEGAYKFSGIKKLDGQMEQGGLRYVMDYQAIIETYKCFALPKATFYDIDFLKPIDISPNVQGHCTHQDTAVAGWSTGSVEGGTVTFKSGFQKQFQSKALFTEKESGWQLLDLGLSVKTFQ